MYTSEHMPHTRPTMRKHANTRRFFLTVPRQKTLADYENLSLLPQGDFSPCDEMPWGVTPPSPNCLPDSVLALVCPKCLCIWYISRGFYQHLKSAQEYANALMPNRFRWFNPVCIPCNMLMREITLDDMESGEEVRDEPQFL